MPEISGNRLVSVSIPLTVGHVVAADGEYSAEAVDPASIGLVTEARLPVLAEELGIVGSGSGVEEVSGTVVLDGSGPAVREFWTSSATTFQANGVDTLISSATGTVWRRTASGSWGYQTVPEQWVTPTATPDTTAPVAGTLAVATTDVRADLTASGASDDKGAVTYAFSKDNGATWTAYQSGATYSFTGLTASTSYTFRHKVKDGAGNETQGAAVTKATTAAPPAQPGDVIGSDDFTGDGALAGRTSTGTLGGPALVWSGVGNAATSGGALVGGSTSGYAQLPVQARADMEASFTIKALPTASSISVAVRNDQAKSHRYVLNILPSSARLQRFGPSGGTIIGAPVSVGALTVGTTATIKVVGSTVTVTIVRNDGNLATITGTDSDVTAAGTAAVDMGASSGGQIDNLVVTAR